MAEDTRWQVIESMRAMLTKVERRLLEKVLDELDRLFDNKSTVADVRTLLVATAPGLQGSNLSAPVDAAIGRLQELGESVGLSELKRDRALYLTDELRRFVAEQLQQDAAANRKRRHVDGRG